jgi:alkyldihydroxyacetonephosphate synthase
VWIDRAKEISLLALFLQKTLQGKEPIGNIHVSASNPISFPGGEAKVNSIAKLVQLRQKDMVKISGYHLRCAERVLDVKQDVIERALLELGCELWNSMCVSNVAEEVPYGSDAWVATLQFAHVVSPALRHTHPQWAEWLCQVEYSAFISDSVSANKSVLTLVKAFQNLFERAEARVDAAIEELRGKSVGTLTSYHVFQIAVENQEDESVPETLLLACSKMKVRDNELPRKLSKIEPSLIDPYVGNEFEELGMWGFKDSRFQVRPDAKGRPTVVLSGSRYELSGKNLTRLIPFIEQETKITIDFLREPPLDVMGLAIDDCGIAEDEVEELCGIVSEISVASSVRIRHGTGHSQEEAYQLRNCDSVRVPDVVVWPCSEHEVEKVVQKAKDLSWNLIPHGGGTNVSHATKCPSREADPRPIISVDMTRLNRIIWVKEEDGLAHVQAGITGKDLMEELKHRGYTIGHEPDSLEFSTLGGWIATKASGMKRSKYGNIEDIVVDIRVVGSNGLLWQGKNDEDTFFHPERESRGTGLLSLFVGSEGCLGIITSAVVRIFPLPLVQEHESILLTDFDTGSKFVYSVSRLGSFVPASVRLLDNAHFRLGLAMRETDSVSDYLRNLALRFLKPSFNSFSSNDVVCVTVVFEGSEVEVRQQRLQIRGLTEQYGGMLLGPGIGRAGYSLTFSIAYLRDFALSYNFLGDSFETFTPWSKLQQIVSSTKSRIKEEHKKRRLPGEVFVGCRVTQLYHSGACLYFYFCMFCGNVMNASKVFSEIEDEARREILRNGGSLSHHHGIGKIRSRYLRDMDSEGCRQALISLKKATDPSDVFGARNGVFGAHIDR